MEQYNEHIVRKNNPRAGLIPVFKTSSGVYEYLMMFPTNTRYGGPHLQISKGMLDYGETALETAIRESEEEIGFKPSNVDEIIHLTQGLTTTRTEVYTFDVFYAMVKSQFDFKKPHYETAYTKWVTREEFEKTGRRNHVIYVKMLDDLLNGIIEKDDIDDMINDSAGFTFNYN